MPDVMSLDPAATSSGHVNHQPTPTMPTNTPMPRMKPDPTDEVPTARWLLAAHARVGGAE